MTRPPLKRRLAPYFLTIFFAVGGFACGFWLLGFNAWWIPLFLIGLGAFLYFLFYRLTQELGRPLQVLTEQIGRMVSEGKKEKTQVPPQACQELYLLARAVDELAEQLGHRLSTIEQQKGEQEAVFSSMAEGVLAVDNNQRISFLNEAARGILGIRLPSVSGLSLQEVVRTAEVQEFIRTSARSNQPAEREIELMSEPSQFLHLRSSPLTWGDGRRIGTVVVFSDVSRLRELEGLRRDFVANVSHELRTPLTLIQGFAETLMNPSVVSEEDRRRFLLIIHRHAARLGAIIDDLLALSRIERDTETNAVELRPGNVVASVRAAIELAEARAHEAKIKIDYVGPDSVQAAINAPLLEQALVNLIENAIKYSEPNKSIEVSVRQGQLGVQLRVKDEGFGIPKKDLPRLFERFYRVDKARSRDKGGTGLGLSIVKHVCLAHRGRIDVDSEPSIGSTFTITLPSLGPV